MQDFKDGAPTQRERSIGVGEGQAAGDRQTNNLE